MDIQITIRRRSSLSEPIEKFSEALLLMLLDVPGLCKPDATASQARLVLSEGHERGNLDFSRLMQRGIKNASIAFSGRYPSLINLDSARSDDFINLHPQEDFLRANPTFFSDTLPCLIEVFDAYRLELLSDAAITIADFKLVQDLYDPRMPEIRDRISGRAKIQRVWPVMYADNILCQRTFGLDAIEVVRRAAPACKLAQVIANGAYLVVTTEIITGADALNTLHTKIVRLIQPDWNDYITQAAEIQIQKEGTRL